MKIHIKETFLVRKSFMGDVEAGHREKIFELDAIPSGGTTLYFGTDKVVLPEDADIVVDVDKRKVHISFETSFQKFTNSIKIEDPKKELRKIKENDDTNWSYVIYDYFD